MRGPGLTYWSDEIEAAGDVKALLDSLAAAGVEIRLGKIDDEKRHLLTPEHVALMRRHQTDILRVLLAKRLVEEARRIRKDWQFTDRRTAVRGRRYGDLMFSARAVLPPGYRWDDVTYTTATGPVDWDHQLTFDSHNHWIEGVAYDPDLAEQLLEENKGALRDAPNTGEE